MLLIQQLLNGLVMGSVYGLFALGFTLLFGVNHVLNMAYGSVFMWGAFAGLYAVTVLSVSFPVALLIGMAVGGVISVLLDLLAFRPLRRRNAPDFSTIASSIGANLVLLTLAQKVSGTQVMRFPFDTFPTVILQAFGLRIQLLQLIVIAIAVGTVLALVYMLYRTGFGRRIRAVAFSERASRLLGIDAGLVDMQVFFVSGALAGIAGVLIGLAFNSVHYMMGEPFLMQAFVAIILGGLGSIPGALLGGLVMGIVQSLSYAYISSAAAEAITFAVLFAIILVRPTGLLGKASTVMRVQRQ
ncbi:branched-chain amino acid ABC transporter permease [Variovorax defluvii]|uniref:Branched-chain amino acid ABC transporter permease n=1 Tax=Variovorax defluvii TaxID=913761 RepID=A0ABP8I960_9BURK